MKLWLEDISRRTIKNNLSHAVREHLSKHHTQVATVSHSIKVDILVTTIQFVCHGYDISRTWGGTDAVMIMSFVTSIPSRRGIY
jgi:hypothetical protein